MKDKNLDIYLFIVLLKNRFSELDLNARVTFEKVKKHFSNLMYMINLVPYTFEGEFYFT